MSAHNIGFYEKINKSVPKSSSNIIKYTPYLFFLELAGEMNGLNAETKHKLGRAKWPAFTLTFIGLIVGIPT